MHFDRGLYFKDETSTHHRLYIPRADNGMDDPELNTGEMHEYIFCVSHVYSRYPPRFTLVWTDYPASESASESTSRLVNNLDLEIASGPNNDINYRMYSCL